MKKDIVDVPTKELEVLDFCFPWATFFSFWAFFLIYCVILSLFGFFNWIFIVPGFLILGFLLNPLPKIAGLFQLIFQNIDALKFILITFFIGWLAFLAFFSPPPYFSGRDEGSYANAAINLANEGSAFFRPEILSILKEEGPAHQSLNFPGFVIKGDSLFSQFSPAYPVFLSIFYKIVGNTLLWSIANGLLILGGLLAIYFILRYFSPRFVAFAGVLVLATHFVFVWFPRFTLSENLAFFLFWNLVLFILIFYFTNDSFIRRSLFLPILSSLVLFPLTRPEGWWVVLAVCFMAFLFRKKIRVSFSRKSILISIFYSFIAMIPAFYVLFLEAPVYKRLVRDWIKWPKSEGFYNNLTSGHFSFENILGAISPSLPTLEKFRYLLKVEWNYGVLFFGIMTLLTFLILVFLRNRSFFLENEKKFLKMLLFLNAPFFIAFISPQISSDHPWLLRRFFFAVLPAGVIFCIFVFFRVSKKISKKFFYAMPVLLSMMFLPSFGASSYFLTVKSNEGREKIFEELGNYFKKDDFVFIHRQASGDGWQMWAGPLLSVYGINAAYVFLPENITDNKKIITERWYQGKKSYVILPEGSFDYEHQLKKMFSLTLERELSFSNDALEVTSVDSGATFPRLLRNEHKSFVYLLGPK